MEEEFKKLWERIVALEQHVVKLTAKAAEHGIHLPADDESAPAENAGENQQS